VEKPRGSARVNACVAGVRESDVRLADGGRLRLVMFAPLKARVAMMENEVGINRMVMEVWDVLGLGRSLFA
jgi:hypothetical protein